MDVTRASLRGPLNGKFVFKQNADGTVNRSKVICTFCQKEFSFHRSCSSLTYHLNAKHAGTSSTATVQSATPSLLLQTPPIECGKRMSKATTENLTNSIARWLARDCRPISIVDDEGLNEAFQVALSDATFKLPSRTTVMNRIHQLYDDERNAKELLAGARHVALTSASSNNNNNNNNNFSGVTAHLIDSEWNLKSFVLTVNKTASRHFGDACAEPFVAATKEWKLENKVTTIGTDSARNLAAAAAAAAAQRKPVELMPCVAHLLQRAITVCLEDSGFDGALARCRKIVEHLKRSPASAEELYQQQTARGQAAEPLLPDESTGWNSTLSMISWYLRNQQAVNASLAPETHCLATLSNLDCDKLQKLEAVLQRCRYVTDLLGGETYVSCSVVLPALCHLSRVMEFTDEDPGYMINFKATFTKDLDTRKATVNHRWLKVATALDPRFKDLKCIHRDERDEVWTWIVEMLAGLEAATAAPQPTGGEPPSKKSFLMLCSSDSDSDNEEPGPLARYKAEPCIGLHECPLKWWAAHAAAYGQLSSLARKYLSTPATSVPCERLFALADGGCNPLDADEEEREQNFFTALPHFEPSQVSLPPAGGDVEDLQRQWVNKFEYFENAAEHFDASRTTPGSRASASPMLRVIKEESVEATNGGPPTEEVEGKYENTDGSTSGRDAAQLHAVSRDKSVRLTIQTSGSPQSSDKKEEGLPLGLCDLDTMDLDQLRREKLKMQLKVLRLQEEYYSQKIKGGKK